MAQLRVFSLIGDSNIRNNVNKTSRRANAAIQSAQVLTCGHFETFGDTLSKVRPESTICIISCITNFLTAIDGRTSVSQRIQPVLGDVRDLLHEVCGSNSTREYFVAPPMYRTAPVWYREGLPEVLTLFSQVLGQDLPGNLHLLPSFATPEFDADGVHLTSFSGLEFLLHLFDSSTDILDRSPDLGETSVWTCEATRVLEDRVMVLEQDHRRLNRVVEHKIAIDAEMSDFRQNERFEDSFVVAGLPAIDGELVGKVWQAQAISDVQKVIVDLMGKELPIIFVQNSTKRYQGAEVTYTVRMASVADSSAIRRKFGSYFIGGPGERRPECLRAISIKNKVTPETNTRISVLKLLAKRYRDSNPGSKVSVIGYDPRPVIKLTPPSSSTSDRRPKTYNYIEAVTKLPINFSASEVEPILRRINPDLSGRLRSIFIVLSDDAFRKILRARKAANPAGQAGTSEEAPTDTTAEAPPQPETNSSRKRGASSPAGDSSAAKK